MIKISAGVVAAVLALNTYLFYVIDPTEVVPPRADFDQLPTTLGEWQCPERLSVGEGIEDRLGVTDYLLCNYLHRSEDTQVNVYVGYHARQVRHGAGSRAESSIHPPRHCLPGSGWQIIEHRVVPFEVAGFPDMRSNELVIAKGDQRQLVHYWYQERGRSIPSDYWKIIYLFWDQATRSRSDGALVRFTTPIVQGDVESARESIFGVAGELLPRIAAYVPD